MYVKSVRQIDAHLSADNVATARCSRGVLASAALLMLLAVAPLARAQGSCTPEEPCVLALGTTFHYVDNQGCTANYIQEYKNRFLAGHFANGTPNDFRDDPVIFAFASGVNIFGDMANMSDPMSLPKTAHLEAALVAAQASNTPFILHIGQWGCLNECFGQPSATVSHLMDQPENWMESPTGTKGFTFPWCDPQYTLTYSLHPDAGRPGPDGLQALFERNLRYVASWIADNITSVPSLRDYLIGVVLGAETHYGTDHWGFDYSAPMLFEYQEKVKQDFGCSSNPSCLQEINSTYGTSFSSLEEIFPPTSDCVAPSPWTSHYCASWDALRNDVLKGHMQRFADIFVEEGVPADLLFGHDLAAAGGFVQGPLVLPNRHPGLSAYEPAVGFFESYADCSDGSEPSCREWAIAEAFFSKNSCGDEVGATCYANDLDRIFELKARFIFVMNVGIDGKRLLGSGWEEGIHTWGMRYSNAYSTPAADLAYDEASRILSGCVNDLDSVWRGPLVQTGPAAEPPLYGTNEDLNDVALEVRIPGQPTIAFEAEVAAAAPWCGAAGTNVELALPLPAANGFSVWAQDYPTNVFSEVFCFRCDDGVDPIQHIDSPHHLQETDGSIQVAGWATDSSGIAEVAFRLDGVAVTLGSFLYGVSRPDVCDFHSELNDPNCPDVGYQGWLDTTAFSDGDHVLEVIATDNGGRSKSFARSFSIVNATPDTEAPERYVDTPSHNFEVAGSSLVSGWATDASGVTQVQFQVDGQPVTLTSYVYGISRSDVCNAFAELDDPNCPYIGYQGWLDTTAFADGTHVLRAIATDGVGLTSTFDRTFRILNGSPDTEPPRQSVDTPSHNFEATGSYLVSGWATDASGVTQVRFEVDGQPVSLSSYFFGISRSDVCSVNGDLDDPNCPYVGYQGWLDTTAFANGTHVLSVIATDGVGLTSTYDRTFRILN